MEAKTCKKCNQAKTFDLFGKHKGNIDGLSIYCKYCARGMTQTCRYNQKLMEAEAKRNLPYGGLMQPINGKRYLRLIQSDNNKDDARRVACEDINKTEYKIYSPFDDVSALTKFHIRSSPFTFKNQYTMPEYLVNIDELIDKI